MPTVQASHAPSDTAGLPLSQGKRTLLSCLLLLQIFATLIGLFSNAIPSVFVFRLRRMPFVAPYLGLLYQDQPTREPELLTFEEPFDVEAAEYRLELALVDDKQDPQKVVVPAPDLLPRQRWWRESLLARRFAHMTLYEDLETHMPKQFASVYFDLFHAKRGVIRCVRRFLRSPEDALALDERRRDPENPEQLQDVYVADVIRMSSTGEIALNKREAAGESAPASRAKK